VASPEFWQFAIPAIASGGASVVAVYLSNRNTARGTAEVNRKVDQAIELSEPTGNGFAKHVLDALEEIRVHAHHQGVSSARIETKIDQHIQDHAASDLMRRSTDK
jgi:imidazoleglycerol phosphate dehydratase HisB